MRRSKIQAENQDLGSKLFQALVEKYQALEEVDRVRAQLGNVVAENDRLRAQLAAADAKVYELSGTLKSEGDEWESMYNRVCAERDRLRVALRRANDGCDQNAEQVRGLVAEKRSLRAALEGSESARLLGEKKLAERDALKGPKPSFRFENATVEFTLNPVSQEMRDLIFGTEPEPCKWWGMSHLHAADEPCVAPSPVVRPNSPDKDKS